jgi:tellurite resistance protein
MIAVATADGRLETREADLIQQIYQDQLGQPVSADMIAEATQGNTRGDLLAQLTAASGTLDEETKEGIIKASYLVLLADDRIAGGERKKLQDIAAALKIPEIHFGAILEDLAVWLAKQKTK